LRTDQLSSHLLEELGPLLGDGEAASVARLVLEDLFGCRRGQRPRLLSQDEQIMAWTTINRLKAGEPVQYVTGIADFYGLQLTVSPAVLIPRSETEELVEWILQDYPADQILRVIDLGTGSGCIPLALKARRPSWFCRGLDVSERALAVAQANAQKLSLPVDFQQVDLLNYRPPKEAFGQVDILVSNPPYIPPSEKNRMGASTVAHEPDLALYVPEEDPLLFYRRAVEIGRELLKPGGRLYVETNEFNNEEVARLFSEMGCTGVQRQKDMREKWRMIRATLHG
jgi:release factor glutamine methyltransferase